MPELEAETEATIGAKSLQEFMLKVFKTMASLKPSYLWKFTIRK